MVKKRLVIESGHIILKEREPIIESEIHHYMSLPLKETWAKRNMRLFNPNFIPNRIELKK